MSACGVILYVLLIAYVMTNLEKSFGPRPGLLGPFLFLLMFVLSAAIVGSLIFGKPTLMYLGGKKKEAIITFIYTLVWLATIVVTILAFVVRR